MGGTCSPAQSGEKKEEEEDVEANIERQDTNAGENMTELINQYQADNEKLKQELEGLRSKNEKGTIAHENKAKRNEEVMKELAAMKELLELKDKALTRGRLEAALRSKATTMRAVESKTRMCMEGNLKHHHRTGLKKSKKDKWVELHLFEGELLTNDYREGYVMITYSETKDAQTANRCQVMDVILNESNSKEVTLLIKVSVEGSIKDLVFICDTVQQRDEWIKGIKTALDEIRSTHQSMHELFTLKLEFAKEKIGIRVAEKHVEVPEVEEKVRDEAAMLEGTMMKSAREIEIQQKKLLGYAEDEVKKLEKANEEASAKDQAVEEVKIEEKPCELLVSNIIDDDLKASGLEENSIIKAINDTSLVGMIYSEQIELLKNTPKPYVLTFWKKKDAPNAYVSILKELVADGQSAVKTAFHELVKGTPFEDELKCSKDQAATITALLSNQRRLMALLQNVTVQEMDL